MAEFLFMMVDHVHADPAEDAVGSNKLKDIVESYPDGRCTEPPSPNSPYGILKMPELVTTENHGDPLVDVNGDTIRCRKWYFDYDLLTTAELDELNANKWITIDQSRHDVLCLAKVS